ncbi:MAG TPA: DEAD/DEAH box helicase [Mycobacteriales bacterium]|nr:DEAD/DEAH box helicase [Mycobacteriales bacterium]
MPGTPARPDARRPRPQGRTRPQHPTRSAPSRGSSKGRSSVRPPKAKSALELGLDHAAELAAAAADQPVPSFHALGLPEALVTALARRGVTSPFAIQVRALPDGIAGRDVLGRGQTGSGKTLAFGLPLLARLDRVPSVPGAPLGLVLVPTRELAQQVSDALAPLGQALGIRVATVYGGTPIGRQIDQVRRGVHVVIATPGRLQDLVDRRAVDLGQVRVTVLDEADHMADLGFMPAVTALLDLTPSQGQRMLFSATLDRGVDALALRYLKDPAMHAVAASDSSVDTMDHVVFAVSREAKVDVAVEIAQRPARTLFFVRTKHGADRLAGQLNAGGASAAAIHGNLNQGQRRRALEAFSDGAQRVLVATDVAARGIHVDDVDLVVHFDPPQDHKDYLHRSGRTARAGARGTVLSLLLSGEVRDHQRLREAAGVEASATSVVPGHPAVRALAESGEAVQVVQRAAPARRQGSRPYRGGQGAQRAGERVRPFKRG